MLREPWHLCGQMITYMYIHPPGSGDRGLNHGGAVIPGPRGSAFLAPPPQLPESNPVPPGTQGCSYSRDEQEARSLRPEGYILLALKKFLHVNFYFIMESSGFIRVSFKSPDAVIHTHLCILRFHVPCR